MAPLPPANSTTSLRSGGNNSSNNNNNNNNNNSVTKNSAQKYLTNCKSLYSCIYCHTHLANHDELVSRSFQGNHGRAYLFNSVINVSCGPAVQRELNTGSHAVADIFCGNCETTLGWKYEKAYVETQKYKEGKYIIELAHVVRENRHLELDKCGELMFFGRNNRHRTTSSSQHSKNNYRSSLTPPSLSQWSSPTSSSNEEVDDEELMFPFYDDLCSSRSSYPSNLSSSHHNRLRRSLYLDSTPYDWKYSTTSSSSPSSSSSNSTSANHHNLHQLTQPQQTTNSTTVAALASSSLGSSDGLSPSTSSSSDNSPEQSRQKSYHASNNNNNTCNSRNTSEHYKEEEETDDNETQFKFEADRPDLVMINSNQATIREQVSGEHCDHLDSGIINVDNNGIVVSLATADQQQTSGDFVIDDDGSEEMDIGDQPSTGSGIGESESNLNQANSISLDDEEFYDCCTDHDVSNLMIASDSTSTLKITE